MPGNVVGERGARVAFGSRPDPAAVRRTLGYMREMDPGRFFALVPELTNFDERAAFEYLPVPSVVAVGTRDHLTPPRYARALADTLPGSRLVVWEGAGHMLMYERREALGSLLARLAEEARA
jgi:pimeloyl-ACP methyl ester carboxylesterase